MNSASSGEPPPGGGTKSQSRETKKRLPNKALLYSDTDVGPFQVMVESFNVFKDGDKSVAKQDANLKPTIVDTDNGGTASDAASDGDITDRDNLIQFNTVNTNSNPKPENLHIGNLHPLSIAKTILELGIEYVKFEKKGRNRLCVTFNDYKAANEFLINKTLIEKGFSMFVPANLVSCKGIVRHVDRSFAIEEVIKYTSARGIKIVNVKRLDRRVHNSGGEAEFKPTSTVLFTFSGKSLPRFVEICGIPLPVEPYVLPVVQCQVCFRYGHTQKNCNSGLKCKNCATSLNNHKEGCVTKCMHCNSAEHTSTSRTCPEYNRQKLIRQVMSLDNLSFYDANIRVPKPNTNMSYFPKVQDFPLLPKSKPDLTIDVNQRRNFLSQPVTSYRAVAAKRKKPSSPIVNTPNYDKQAHNDCLISPNGRASNPAKSNAFNYVAVEPNSTVVAEDSVSTLLYIFNNLTVTERELVLQKLSLNFQINSTLARNADCNSNASPSL